ncbi:MAG: hypothetical protein JSR77_11115 [Planctomycetes bacterium]|nr:hypothetical protein [Planctomycetota bacterium]
MRLLLAVLGALLLTSLVGCETTTVTTVWKSPDPPRATPFNKIVGIVVNATPAERRSAEDQLAAEAKNGRGIAAYTLVPDEDLKDREKVKKVLEANGIDGAVVLRLTATDRQSVYHPPVYTPSTSMYGYREYDLYRNRSPGYTTTTVTIHAEISIYSVSDEKLIWAGSSSTDDPANIQDLVKQVAKASIAELKKQGLMKE